jgi:hypothetical protein
MRYLTRKMMMTSGQILVGRAVGGAILAMAITMTTATVRRTRRVLRKGLGTRREYRTGRGTRRGRGRERAKGKLLLNEPQGVMISLVPLLCSCSSKGQRQT